MSAEFDLELAYGPVGDDGDEDEIVWEEPTHNMLGRAVTEGEWDEWVIGRELGALDAANAANAAILPGTIGGARLPRAVMRDVHEDLYRDGIVDIDLLHAVTEASHWEQWCNFKADYKACSRQMTLWVDDEGRERDYTEPMDVIDDENPYWGYIDLGDSDGRAVALPRVPGILRGTDAARQIMEAFEAANRDDAAASATALARAIYRLEHLDRLAFIAKESRGIPAVWEYPYTAKSDPFHGELANVLAAIHGIGHVGKREAREAMERANAGAWDLISTAALNVDDDYRAAVSWAEQTGDDKWGWVAKEYETTRDRYLTLRAMHNRGIPDGLREAVMGGRATREARVAAVTRPIDRVQRVGQLMGQGHLSGILQDVRAGASAPERRWRALRRTPDEYEATVSVSASPSAHKAMTRIREIANRTDSGLRSMLDAVNQVIEQATESTDDWVNIPTSAFVRARRATASSENVHHPARDYRESINDMDALLEAVSYMHLKAEAKKPVRKTGSDGKTYTEWVPETYDAPLFFGIHVTEGKDEAGNPIRSYWRVNAHSMDIFRMAGFVNDPQRMPLLDQGDSTNRLTDLEATLYRFIDEIIREMQAEGKTEHTVREGELANLGHGDSGLTARQRRDFLDRLAPVCVGTNGTGLLRDIERTYRNTATLPNVRITPVTKKGNRRKDADGNPLPPKTKLVGLELKITGKLPKRA